MDVHPPLHDHDHGANETTVDDSDNSQPGKGTMPISRDEDAQRLLQEGFAQQLDRNLNFASILLLLICSNGAWISLAGALQLGIVQGGPCSIIYGFILTFFLYCLFGACTSDLVSAMPSAAGPYHWVFMLGGDRWRHPVAFVTAYMNLFMWLWGCCSDAIIVSQQLSAIIAIGRGDILVPKWATTIMYEGILLTTILFTIFGHKYLKWLLLYGGFAVLLGLLIITPTVPILAPKHRSSRFVWSDFTNHTGWSSNVITFLIGLPNSFYAYGLLDTAVHMAEEVPRPQTNIPKAIFLQFAVALPTGLLFLAPMFYSIQDVATIADPFTGNSFISLLAQVAPRIGAICLALIPVLAGAPATYESQVITSRLVWSLSRQNAFPYSSELKKVHPKYRVPVASVLTVLIATMLVGVLYPFAETAFDAIIDSCLVFHNCTFAMVFTVAAIRARHRSRFGPFRIPGLALSIVVFSLGALFMAFTTVIFCLPAELPVTVDTFNWTSVILGGALVFTLAVYVVYGRHHFSEPPLVKYFPIESPPSQEVAVSEKH